MAVSLPLTENDKVLLAELTKHPGWVVLKRVVEEEAERKALTVAKNLLHTLEPLDQSQLWYDRGYWQAMQTLVSRPEKAATRQTKEQ